MKRKLLFRLSPLFGGILAISLFFSTLNSPGKAAPAAQFTPFPTPTPGSDGRIVYVAQEKDSAWRIAAVFGIELATLRTLNKWGENPIIKPGDEIILGFAGPAEINPTLGPSPTPQPSFPTDTSQPGWGNLCILLYNDLNGDSIRQEDETSIPGGAISISNRAGTVSKTENTQEGSDPHCFEDLPEGTYNISMGVPDGYNPTTVMNLTIALRAGDINYLDFGAQADTRTILEQPAPQGSGNNPILGIIGGLILALGAGIGLFAGRLVGTGSPRKSKLINKQ